MLSLRQGNQYPGENKPKQHAAIVAKKNPGSPIGWVAQIEIEEPGDAAHDRDNEYEVGIVLSQQRHQCGKAKADEGKRAREAINAVNHVQRIDQPDGGKNGERDA